MRAGIARSAPHGAAGALVIFSLLGAGCSEAPPAHCQDEVTAAFKRLKTLPYRMETIRVYKGQAEFHMTSEFFPPDRRRYITYNSNPYYTSEAIDIGERTWARWPRQNEGWSEVKAKAVRIIIRRAPKDGAFACLGPVEFNGKAYIGYRARAAESFVLDVLRPRGEKALQEDLAAIRHMPQPWRTVLLEASSLLPAYDLLAQESQFDSPSMSSEHYTYPEDLRIEPPVQQAGD
jgi:hypothetical protein